MRECNNSLLDFWDNISLRTFKWTEIFGLTLIYSKYQSSTKKLCTIQHNLRVLFA